eukprot:1541660-Amphidinium_carterae.1
MSKTVYTNGNTEQDDRIMTGAHQPLRLGMVSYNLLKLALNGDTSSKLFKPESAVMLSDGKQSPVLL